MNTIRTICEDSLEKFHNFSKRRCISTVINGYEEWANCYDEDFDAIDHRGHVIIGDVMEELYPSRERDSISILDLPSATGRVGKELLERGFSSVDGVDACAAMVTAAKEKNVYRKLIQSRVGLEPLNIPDDSYDAITCCAGFEEGHLDAHVIEELVRLTKPGGVVVLLGNAYYWDSVPDYFSKMAAVIEGLEQAGKSVVVRAETSWGLIGDRYPARVIVLKKL